MRALRLQLIALLAAVAVLFSSGASGRTQYLCRITGLVLSDCCCAEAGSAHAAPRREQARSEGCCERIVSAARSGATGTRDALKAIAAPALAAVLHVPAFGAPAAQVVAVLPRSTRASPALGPPLFVAHCALLL